MLLSAHSVFVTRGLRRLYHEARVPRHAADQRLGLFTLSPIMHAASVHDPVIALLGYALDPCGSI